jgi:hypothetical protein
MKNYDFQMNDYNVRIWRKDDGKFSHVEVYDFDWDCVLFTFYHEPETQEIMFVILDAYNKGRSHGQKQGEEIAKLNIRKALGVK